MSKSGLKFGAIALMFCCACEIPTGIASAAPPEAAAPRLVEYSEAAAVFLIEERAVLVRLGERIPDSDGTLRFLNEGGATVEYPSAPGSPGTLRRLQRGAVLPRRSDSNVPPLLEPEPALSAIQARDTSRGPGNGRARDPDQ